MTSAQRSHAQAGPRSRSMRSGANKVGVVNGAMPKRGSAPKAEDSSIQAKQTRNMRGTWSP